VSLLRKAEVDRAVFYIFAQKIWSLPASIVSMIFIIRFLSPDYQGFYVTFGSLLALTSFFELGFAVVILNVTSNEWAKMNLGPDGRITGNPDSISRLVSLGRLCFKWYGAVCVLFMLGVGLAGFIFFARGNYPGIDWKVQWLSLVVVSGLNLWTLPFLTILEGCKQIGAISRVRLYQGVVSSITLWVLLTFGANLSSLVVTAIISLVWSLWVILVKYRCFFQPFYRPPEGKHIDWQKEVWPMQWRLAMSGLVNYLAFNLFNPIMFNYFGAATAGQMGITRNAVGAVQGLGMAWVSAKAPTYGVLVSKRDYNALDEKWVRSSVISVLVVTLGGTALWAVIYVLGLMGSPFAQRFLGPIPVAIFVIAAVFAQISQCQSAYLFAHKQHPILVMSIVCSILIGLLVFLLGRSFGPLGAAAANLGVWIIIVIWETYIWRRCRRDWHLL
jgi:O-antigen/teichoic acid export membrane protein